MSYTRRDCSPHLMDSDPDDEAIGYWFFTLLVAGAFIVAARRSWPTLRETVGAGTRNDRAGATVIRTHADFRRACEESRQRSHAAGVFSDGGTSRNRLGTQGPALPTATGGSCEGCVSRREASLVRWQRAFPDVGSTTGDRSVDLGGDGPLGMKYDSRMGEGAQRCFTKVAPLGPLAHRRGLRRNTRHRPKTAGNSRLRHPRALRHVVRRCGRLERPVRFRTCHRYSVGMPNFSGVCH